eukprot:355658-Chlamydomonas_euryale.AAC.5
MSSRPPTLSRGLRVPGACQPTPARPASHRACAGCAAPASSCVGMRWLHAGASHAPKQRPAGQAPSERCRLATAVPFALLVTLNRPQHRSRRVCNGRDRR